MLFCILIFSSCEKVIDVKLSTEPSRLVVDATLSWVKGTNGKSQSVFLSTTTSYYSQEIPKVSDAIVYINNSTNTKFEFLEETATKGKYTCANFSPVIGENYTLTIVYKGETYKAQEKLTSVSPIENVEQRSDLGINRDEYGIKVNFQDPIAQNNFYLVRFVTSTSAFPSFEVFHDQFFDGKKGFGLYGSDKLKKDDAIEIKLNGISERYFDYMKKLTATASGGGGGPFQPTPSSAIRGNVVNQSNESNFCLGYFSVSETDILTYTVK